MRLEIEWAKPVLLRSTRAEGLIYDLELERLEEEPGVYVFARKWGASYEALYVGQTRNIRRRVRGHLNNLRLMRHVQDAKNGRRVLIAGYAITKPGQQMPKVLATLERTLLRHFLIEGHDLVNKQGTRIRRHSIESSGPVPRSFMPRVMYLERRRGE